MATVYMTRVLFPVTVDGNGQHGLVPYPNDPLSNNSYEYKGPQITGVGNGDSVLLPPEIKGGSASLILMAAGTAQIFYTTDPVSAVLAGTATWVALGSALTATGTVSLPICSAFRCQVTSGNWILSARVQ
jgi:hypothetical protein